MTFIAFCFAALFASTFAAPLLEEDGFEDDPFGNFSREASVQDIENKIVGGSETKIENHPYIFSLRHKNAHLCGGSVLTSTRGLTSAQCFLNTPSIDVYSIVAGSTTLVGDQNKQLRPLSDYISHPDYNKPRRYENDIAIAYWEKPLTFAISVRAIDLPPQGTVPDYTKPASVAGWGWIHENATKYSNILKSVSLPLISYEICNGINSYDGLVAASMLCAGSGKGGQDSCNGDNGGPLVMDKKLIGVVSWGFNCARPNFPGVYTRVSSFTNWIKENM